MTEHYTRYRCSECGHTWVSDDTHDTSPCPGCGDHPGVGHFCAECGDVDPEVCGCVSGEEEACSRFCGRDPA